MPTDFFLTLRPSEISKRSFTMRKLRILAAFCLLLASSAISASSLPPQVDGGDLPPLCLPSNPNCTP
jgi:hypothetical protein